MATETSSTPGAPYRLAKELTVESLEAGLSARVHGLLRERLVVGASVVVVRAGAPATDGVGGASARAPFSYCKTFGYADLSSERGCESATRPRRESMGSIRSSEVADPCCTLFDLGSHARLLAAVGLLQLWEEEAVELDRDVNEYLAPEVAVKAAAFRQPLHLAHLLAHTSGFRDCSDGASAVDAVDATLAAAAAAAAAGAAAGGPAAEAAAAETPLGLRIRSTAKCTTRATPPGTSHAECAHNYELVGSVVESMSGLEYSRCMARRTLGALGVASYERLCGGGGVGRTGLGRGAVGAHRLHRAGAHRVTRATPAAPGLAGVSEHGGGGVAVAAGGGGGSSGEGDSGSDRRPGGRSNIGGGGEQDFSAPATPLTRESVEVKSGPLTPNDGLSLTSSEMCRVLAALLTPLHPDAQLGSNSGGGGGTLLTAEALGLLHDSHFRWRPAPSTEAEGNGESIVPEISSSRPSSAATAAAAAAAAETSSASRLFRGYGTGSAGDTSLGMRRRPLHWGDEAPPLAYHSSDQSLGEGRGAHRHSWRRRVGFFDFLSHK
jgi:CubicO group peptidase (beta-lactamase class C family)